MTDATPLGDQRDKFLVDDEVAYFNTAAMSPVLRTAHDAAVDAVDRRSKPWLLKAEHWFPDVEQLRRRLASVINADADRVALVPSTSYGLAAVARNLSARPGDRVLVLANEFPSSYYTWRHFTEQSGAELLVVTREPDQTWTEAVLSNIDERVTIASVPNVHWTNGSRVDLDIVGPALRDVGAAFIVDASQSLGVIPLDVMSLRPDAVVSVGYKWLLGPYSLGYMYVDPRFHDGEALEQNWIARLGSDDFTSLSDYNDVYEPGARRFDVGERSNFQLLPMAIAALDQILAWTPQRIAASLRAVTDEIATGADALGLTTPAAAERAPHMLGIGLPVEAARAASQALEDAKVVASVRGPSLRIAPHLHVSDGDVQRLLGVLESIA
ncbi:MAG: aminotransferase class V-fold PLP-dependent enzyme [Actinomycetes bacterium]